MERYLVIPRGNERLTSSVSNIEPFFKDTMTRRTSIIIDLVESKLWNELELSWVDLKPPRYDILLKPNVVTKIVNKKQVIKFFNKLIDGINK